MTSNERRELRYQRRKQKRLNHRIQRVKELGSLDDIFSYKEMFKYGKKCCNGVRWKNSTQRFEMHLFSKTARNRKSLLQGTWKQHKYKHFTVSERGKTREIDAPHIEDRQIHKLFSQKVLCPIYSNYLIYNNGASLKGKGLSFSQKQLKKDLKEHIRRHGLSGKIILLDFKGFFPNASHDTIIHNHSKYLLRNDLKKLAYQIVKNNNNNDIGLPIGLEPSQMEMITYTCYLDNYIKCQLSMKHFGHYMDDYYILVKPNEKNAKEILHKIINKAESIGLIVNRSKTRIQSISKFFRYCKAKYILHSNCKIITRCCRGSLKRLRRKLYFFKKMVDNHIDYIYESLNSSFAYLYNYDNHRDVLKIKRLFFSKYKFSFDTL